MDLLKFLFIFTVVKMKPINFAIIKIENNTVNPVHQNVGYPNIYPNFKITGQNLSHMNVIL